jgi:hypothetical protein
MVGKLRLGVRAHPLRRRVPPAEDVVGLPAAGLVPPLPHHVVPPEVQEVPPGRLADPAHPGAAAVLVRAADGRARDGTVGDAVGPERRVEVPARCRPPPEVDGRRGVQLAGDLVECL